MDTATDTGRAYWQAVLTAGGATAIPRWAPDPRPGVAEIAEPLPPALVAAAGRLADARGVGRDAVLLAAHAVVLAALSGEREVVTGYVAEPGGAPLPCRLVTGQGPWAGLLAQAGREVAALVAHRDVALDEVAAGLGVTAPTFETVLDPTGTLADPRGDVVLAVGVREDTDGLALVLRFRTDALDADAVSRIAGYHRRALERLTETDPDAEPGPFTLLGADELGVQLEDMAGPEVELPDRRAHEIIEEQVRTRPDEVAAACGNREWTYAELNARANRLAGAILARGLPHEGVVAVVTERNLDWAAAVLAIFKAGKVYLPIEPHFPSDRIATTLGRAGCTLVLTEPASTGTLAPAVAGMEGVETLFVDDALAEGHPDADPGIAVAPDQAAYVYFTSGSTGEPKGAMCEHAGMVNHLYAKIEDLGVVEGTVVAQTAPQCFDISLWQLVSAWLVGGRTLIIEQDTILDVARYVDTVAGGRVGVLQVVPSYLEAVLAHLEQDPRALPDLRCVSATGEALKKELVVRWFASQPGIALVNAYGLTETSDDTNHAVMTEAPAGDRVPLGPPVRNVRVYVVDEYLSPVPLGAPGEIVFSGVCVGRGYVNDPERTKAAFTADPHRPGERLYRSGDHGRWAPGGSLQFLGRKDSQIKIRGFRIEIGEIDNRLLDAPGVRDAAVVVPTGADHLVAFYSGRELDPAELRERLGAALPPYMVPSVFHWQETLPLTANSKIDKKALTALAGELEAVEATYQAPETPTEQRLTEVWAKVLGLDAGQIGRGDDFFDRGGTSLSAVKLVIGLDRAVTPKDIARHPVLSDLAALLDSKAGEGRPSLVVTSSHNTGRNQEMTMFSTSPLDADVQPGRPPIVTVAPGTEPAEWAAGRRDAVRALVAEHGAVLVRGLGVRDAATAGAVFVRLAAGGLAAEREAFAPRQALGGGVYSSTTWPANQPMCMHHELSYASELPATMMFACLTPPASGGTTGVADGAAVLASMPQDLVARVERDGWILARTYGEDIGASWAEAFGTDDRGAVEAYCRANWIEFAWLPDDGLQTRQRRPAVVRHPVTGARTWFNQMAFLSEWTMDPEVREFLVDVYGEDGLPFTTRFGDGAPVTADVVATINGVYDAHTRREPWQAGDVMVVDNIATAHCRDPYDGPREIVVGLADPIRGIDLAGGAR